MVEPHSASHHLLLLFIFLSTSSIALHGPHGASAQPTPLFACDTAKNPQLAALGFCNRSLPVEARVSDLVGRMTVQEKLGFLPSKNGAIDRLGIPAYEWWSEALHGVSDVGPGTRFTAPVPGGTSFPQVILTAASFNATLFETIGKVVSTEARAMHNMGLAGLTYWSPNVNIFRDPRWGRGQETPGEDPVLASKYAVSYVRGLQTADHDPNALKVAACCKHYTAYDVDAWKGVERYTFNAIVTKQDMDDTFQPPFKSCVVEGNVASVMCSYNKVNGVPTCADPDLLAGTIRGDWKLNGYIVSDCDSVQVLFQDQHYTKTPEEAVAKSVLAGLDLNCGSFVGKYAANAVASGLLPISAVDKAVANNVATLIRLGFFDGDPSQLPYGNLGPKDVCTPEHQELARDAARQGIVLLKNDANALPLHASAIKSLAVIGPNANVSHTMIGNYEGKPCSYITPLQGLTAVVPTVFAPGCTNVACAGASLQLDQAKLAASQADATLLVVGLDQSIERESLDRNDLLLPGQQSILVSEVAKVAKGPVILVIMSAGPIDISFAKTDDRIPAILWVGYPGEKGGGAIADVVFGAYNPSGRLPVTWYPQSYVEKIPMTDMNMRPNPATGYPGRTYRFYKGDVVYPFGAGLSYTQVKHHLVQAPKLVAIPLEESHPCRAQQCKSVHLADRHCGAIETFAISLRVQNLGGMDVSHTIFLFSSPPAVHNAPIKHLLGFEKVYLGARETKAVSFQVDVCKDLSLVDESGNRKVALGPHVLHVGDLMHSLHLRV